MCFLTGSEPAIPVPKARHADGSAVMLPASARPAVRAVGSVLKASTVLDALKARIAPRVVRKCKIVKCHPLGETVRFAPLVKPAVGSAPPARRAIVHLGVRVAGFALPEPIAWDVLQALIVRAVVLRALFALHRRR